MTETSATQRSALQVGVVSLFPEMIREAARIPELEYKFSNPLTQEVTYQTILHKRRRDFHNRVGLAMEALFPQQLSEDSA